MTVWESRWLPDPFKKVAHAFEIEKAPIEVSVRSVVRSPLKPHILVFGDQREKVTSHVVILWKLLGKTAARR